MLQAIELARLQPAPAVRPRPRPPAPGGHTGLEPVEVPAGPCEIGAPAAGFAYDNERPRHRVELPAFRIGRTPITNATFLSFVEGGGYERREWWSDEGVGVEGGVRHHTPPGLGPRAHGDGGAGARRLGAARPRTSPWSTSPGSRPTPSPERTAPASPRRPSGRRRRPGTRRRTGPAGPWRRAPARGGTSTRGSRPAPAGATGGASPCGALGMLGDVWEWTATEFRGYDGFVAHPYREYSEVFFGDGYQVLRGGSWATRRARRDADVPQLGPAAAAADLLRGEAGMGRVSAELRIDVHVGDGAARAARRRARRPHAAVQGAAAQAPLRRPRRRAVRPHLRAARVLPDAHRARDPRPLRGRDRRGAPAWPSWSSSAPARPPRRACCSTPWTAPGRSGATCRSTSPSRPCATARRRSPTSTPGLDIHGIVGDFERHLRRSRRRSRAARASSPSSAARSATSCRAPAAASCARSPACSAAGDYLLLGTDLVKDLDVLEAAYDDAAGVTAEFNRNVLHVLNRELDADFPTELFEHVAFFDPDHEWIEMRLRARRACHRHDRRARPRGRLRARRGAAHRDLGQVHARAGGGRLRGVRARADEWFTDDDGLFALSLRRAPSRDAAVARCGDAELSDDPGSIG